LPLLKECAEFYEDFLFTDEPGKYRFSPSYSAENGCGDNSTMDIAVACRSGECAKPLHGGAPRTTER
jgi:hypothetical protein